MCPVGEIDEQQDSGEELQAIDEEEDVTCIPCLPTPYQPTLREFLDHCVTHFPYRAWCRHCLEGRGRVRARLSQWQQGAECSSGSLV